MKEILFAGFAILSQLISAVKNIQLENRIDDKTFIARGPIAWYPLDGDAKDYSGHNKHGRLMNGTKFSADAGNKANAAAWFDGKDDYILIKDANNYFAPAKLSVSFLVNLRNVSERSALFTKSAFDTPKALTWGTFITDKLAFRATDPADGCDALWYDDTSYDLYSKTELKNNRWYAVTLIYTSRMKLIYLNGMLNSATISAFSRLKQCQSADLRIGGWWKNDIISIHGKMDNIRIYDRVLSEDEIKQFAHEIQGKQ